MRGRVKSFLYEGQIYPKFSYILIEPIECRQLEKLQIGVDRVINDVKVTFTNTYVYLFYPHKIFTFFIPIKFLPFLSLSNVYLFYPYQMFTFFILTKFLPFLSLSNIYLFYPYQIFTFFILIKYLPFLSLSNFYLFHPFIVNFFAFYPQGVQKDINMLNGKLERSFFEISMGMKAKIRNKEPYVEHSMGLLR